MHMVSVFDDSRLNKQRFKRFFFLVRAPENLKVEELQVEHNSVHWSICSEASSKDWCSRSLDELSEEGNTNLENLSREKSPDSDTSSEAASIFVGNSYKRAYSEMSKDESSQDSDEFLEKVLDKKVFFGEKCYFLFVSLLFVCFFFSLQMFKSVSLCNKYGALLVQ